MRKSKVHRTTFIVTCLQYVPPELFHSSEMRVFVLCIHVCQGDNGFEITKKKLPKFIEKKLKVIERPFNKLD